MPIQRRTALATAASFLLPATLAGTLAGCGGGTDRTKAQMRLVNASGSSPNGYAALDLREEGALRQTGVGYGGSAGYADLDPDLDSASIHAAGSATALLSFTPPLAKNRHYTLLAFGNTGALRQALLDDNLGEPEANRSAVRIVNAAPDAGTLDVYITAGSDALAQSVPVQSGAAYGSVGGWFTVTSGTWRVRVAAAGSGASSTPDLRLDLDGVVLGSRQVLTLVLAPTRGGALVNALWLTQEGSIVRADSASARVRAVAGSASGGTVAATLGGTALLGGVGSPALGTYALVSLAAGTSPALTVTVNGAAVAAPAPALSAGGDYTLLVHGSLAAPVASVIPDDNRLPTTAGSARVRRLVSGVSGTASPVALKIDFVSRAENVAAGTGSDYATLAASTAADLQATVSGVAAPIATLDDKVLAADSVYTVFVVGAVGAATAILNKDR